MSLPPFVLHFSELADPRMARTRRRLLMEILVIAFCAVLCGAEGREDIERFGLAKERWLKEWLGLPLPNGIPSDDTFRRVFSRLHYITKPAGGKTRRRKSRCGGANPDRRVHSPAFGLMSKTTCERRKQTSNSAKKLA